MPSHTYRGFVILPSNFKSSSDADIKAAVAHGKRIKMYPLGASPDSTAYVDMYDKAFDATIPYDFTFFEALNRFVQAEPWLTCDKVMIDVLKTIGIEKGKAFRPDEKTKHILADAAREAQAVIVKNYETGFAEPFFTGTHWALPVPKETVEGMSTMFADPTATQSMAGPSIFRLRTSARSTWVLASSISLLSMTASASRSTGRRPIASLSRRTLR